MENRRALIVDDEPDIRELLEITLGRMDIDTRAAKDIAGAHAFLAEETYDFCLTDMQLPDGNGIELVHHITTEYPSLPVAMITAHGNMESAVEALKAGAFDFVSKPVNLELLRKLVDTALNLKPLDDKIKASDLSPTLLGETEVMKTLRKQIDKLARSQAPIYISGQSGSGKELAARSIHELGPHRDGAFVPVNCGAIPGELMESEFFGHMKGSFTGANSDKEGLFQAANGGTLFLDEVADLPLSMQVKLLRAIQEKAVRPIGAQQEVAVDVRILSATHRDLAAEVEKGNFRQDLYYRLNVIELRMPSLSERAEDIPVLAKHLLARISADYGMEAPGLSNEAMEALKTHSFPGNVRELENVLERAFTLCEDDVIKPEDLNLNGNGAPAPQRDVAREEHAEQDDDATDTIDQAGAGQGLPEDADSLDAYLENIEKNVIVEALEATRWNKTAAAKKLGITFRALRYKLKKLDLE